MTRYATGRGNALGVLVTATVGAGVALDATDAVGATVGAGVATHADAQNATANATTWFFTKSSSTEEHRPTSDSHAPTHTP